MTTLEFSAVVMGIAAAGGFLGSLTGLGGAVVVTPALTLLLGVDLRYAMGASLISVIATSSGAAAAYVKEGYSNIRAGMFLEIATTAGAIAGAHLTTLLSGRDVALLFGALLLYSAWHSLKEPVTGGDGARDPLAQRLRLDGHYPTRSGLVSYHVQRVKAGFALMFGAGLISGLLGVGSGAMKVIAMDQIMRMPFKASTTTSNFMIGVTAAASAGIYLRRGYVDPRIAMPVMLGVLAGSFLGARHLAGARTKQLRLIFGAVIGVMAVEMIYGGLTGETLMTDERLELLIANLLRAGVISAAATVFAGGVWYVASTTLEPPYRAFSPAPLLAGRPAPEVLIAAGLLLLVATPVARVIFALVGFAIERDWLYVALTAIVLAILAYSLFA